MLTQAQKKTNSSKLVFFIPALLIALYLIQHQLRPDVSKQNTYYLTPPELKHFTFGFSEVIADSIWLRALQDMDYCSDPISKKECQGKSWLFRMLYQITELSPQFREPYAVGGLALTVLISDYAGASIIFDRGVAALPKDWTIAYRAAYHVLYEEKNNEKAARYLKQAGDHGAPKWVYSLAGRLATEAGQVEFTRVILEELKSRGESKELIEKIEKRLPENQSR